MSFKFLLGYIPVGAHRRIPVAYVIWFGFALIAVLAELLHHSINNYLIYKNVFWHLIKQKNLYLQYPAEYEDLYLYGPIFSLVIAPFSILPNWAGVILWVMANAFLLFYAIRQLPLKEKAVTTIFLIAAIEFMTSSRNVQFNPMVAAWIILSYTCISKGKDFWGSFFIVLGFLAKIYGIVGIIFFCFSKHKLKFVVSFLFWLVVLFLLPMLISSPAYIVQTYVEWFKTLSIKNLHNEDISFINMQDLTVMGMIRRTFRYAALSNLTVLLPATLLLGLPLLRFALYHNKVFQLYYLCLALITVVIFSSSAESATYVIAMVGVAIWYVLNQHRDRALETIVLILALLITSLCSTDLVPQIIKHEIVRKYALKALPCFIVWIILIYDITFKREDCLVSPAVELR